MKTPPSTDPPAIEPTVGPHVLRALVETLERAGASRAAFLKAAGLDESALSPTGARIPLRALAACCERALEMLQDPALGLHCAEHYRERSFGPVSHLLVHAGTLRRCFELLAQFEPLLSDTRSYTLVEDDDTITVRKLSGSPPSPTLARFSTEILLAGMMTMVRGFFLDAKPLAARFAYAAPDYRAEYDRVFGVSASFEQPWSELVFERALFDRLSPHGDQAVHAAVKTIAERDLVRLQRGASYAERLHDHLLASWPDRPVMDAAARALGMSRRTLHRQLTSEGKTYRDVEYAVLAIIAKRLLCDRALTIQETAHEMGFADAATFHRAFKSWTGLTPSAFREQANE